MNFTPLARPFFLKRASRCDFWRDASPSVQMQQLRRLLLMSADTEVGRRYGFASIANASDSYAAYAAAVPLSGYEEMRSDVMRMIAGERDVLWPGHCRWYAQSSGTSGGKSKFIPITDDSLRFNHYPGASDAVAHYLARNPDSRIFAGKGMALGGSFSNELQQLPVGVHVGDLSATLIQRIPFLANMMRIPSKQTALIPDWKVKLPELVNAAVNADVTNISGVPSWFLMVIKEMLKMKKVETLADIWPNLEVFFHGGISFVPYRDEYERLTEGCPIHFVETYNASEGFFSVQNDPSERAMLLLIDVGVFYEFIDLADPSRAVVSIDGVKAGRTYELVISASNGLWRYRLGDTVKVESTAPVKITIAGRTKSFINAFGEELMECNADQAIADVSRDTGASIRNYSAAPVFASDGRRGRHEWIIEWETPPIDSRDFALRLDIRLQQLNSDYQAKRADTIFLDPLTIVNAKDGLFDKWLASSGSQKLGGQRKVPRLNNDRNIADALLALNAD